MTVPNAHEFVEKIDDNYSPLTMAIVLARQGFPVFPVHKNKVPACTHGFKDAAKEEESVVRLWTEHPAPLVGVATGESSGFDALDIDPRHGGDKWLDEHVAKIPATLIHRTRSGGWHYLFRHHAGLRNSAGRIAAGVDVRADGGSLIWWPAAGFPILNDAPVAPWPDWLLSLALPPPRPFLPAPHLPVVKRFQDLKQAAYARAALHRAFRGVLTAAEGTRNETLNRETWALMRFVEAGVLSAQDIANALVSAALAAGLDRSEVTATVASAIRARGTA